MNIPMNTDQFILLLMSLPFIKRMLDVVQSRFFSNEDKMHVLYYLLFLGLYLARLNNPTFFLDLYQIPFVYVGLWVLDHEIRQRRSKKQTHP